jgi:C4-dicarboxylate transporter DctM subunit
MFTAGIPSGILVGVFLCLYCYISSKKRGYAPKEKVHVPAGEAIKIIIEALPAFAVPVIILGGIYGGFVTPTESAALGCLVGIVVSIFVYKEAKLRDLPYFACHSMLVAAPVMFIIGMSTGFGSLLSMAKVPTMVANAILSITDSRIILLMIINVVYLIMGTFMETNATIILMTPILLPVVTAVGVSPIQFGLITIVNLAIGFVTPPLGANLFMASAIGRVDLNILAKTIWPWIVTMILALLLITYVPVISLGLPMMMGLNV